MKKCSFCSFLFWDLAFNRHRGVYVSLSIMHLVLCLRTKKTQSYLFDLCVQQPFGTVPLTKQTSGNHYTVQNPSYQVYSVKREIAIENLQAEVSI